MAICQPSAISLLSEKTVCAGNSIQELSWNVRNKCCKGVSQEPKLIKKNLDAIEQKLNKAMY